MILRCAAYARYSSDLQSPRSIEDQLRICREYANARGFIYLEEHVYVDEALSGVGADRPGLNRLLDAALSPTRPFDIILLDDSSRLARNTKDALTFFERLNFAGIRLIAVSQGIDSDNEQAHVLVTVHGMVDSLYVKELAKKTHRGLEGLMLRGQHTGGRCFGYDSVPVPGTTGKQLVINESEAAVVQALKKAEQYRQVANTPQPIGANTSLTVAELVEHYKQRELGDDSGKATKPRKAYLYIFTNYILPKWGSLPLRAVKAVAVEDWLKTLPLANGSKAKVREVFGAAFRHAIRHELYPTNPIASVRQARKRATEPEILEPVEILAILNELEGVEPVRTAFLIAAVMGMRRSEIFGLKWADVDFVRAILHVRRSFVDGVVGPPKTDSSRRPLPIPPAALGALKAWRGKSSYTASDDWVFASDISFGKQPLWPGTLWRRNVAPAIERAGITKPKLGWHSLRRSYASLLLSSGASLRVSMELMRHSTAEMTLGTYAQSVGNEKRDAGERVALLVLEGGKAA